MLAQLSLPLLQQSDPTLPWPHPSAVHIAAPPGSRVTPAEEDAVDRTGFLGDRGAPGSPRTSDLIHT